MKKVLSCCLGLVLLAIGLLVLGVQTMPSNYEIMRSQVVTGSTDEVYAVASDLHTWPDWTVWNREEDPSAVWDWTGPPAGVGSTMSWKGDVHGEGRLAITAAEAGKSIDYDLTFIEEGNDMISHGRLLLTPSGEGTQVVWTMSGELDGVWKIMSPLLDGMIGEMFETGLVGLDAHMQAKQSE